MIPDSLQSKIDQARAERQLTEPKLPSIEPGELVIAESPSGRSRRIVVITQSEAAGICRIQLTTNELEMATDLDMRIDPEQSAFPTELLAQPELFGPVFKSQLIELVGQISPQMTESLAHALRSEGGSIPAHLSGLPLGGPDDPRRSFKEDELDDLDAIVQECRAWLMGAASEVRMLDPKAFLPPPEGASDNEMIDAYLDLLDTLNAVESGSVEVPDLESLFDDEAFADLDRWSRVRNINFNFWEWWMQHCGRVEVMRQEAAPQQVSVDDLRDAVLGTLAVATMTVDFVSRPSLAGESIDHPSIANRTVAA